MRSSRLPAFLPQGLLRIGLLLVLAGGILRPAEAQTSCTRYLNASDGLDTNPGTSPAQAVRSFEHAFRTFPTGCTVYMTAGEYFFAQDADGIQLNGSDVRDKSMTFVLQRFADSTIVRFSEKEWVQDIGSGTITFRGEAGTSLAFGRGVANNPAAFGASTNFLHTLALLSGTLDVRAVPTVRIGEPVGNPGFTLASASPPRRAPADAAITRGDGHLLGTPAFAPATRTVRYTGRVDVAAGAELPPGPGIGQLLFEHAAGSTVTVPTALQLNDGALVALRGGGDVRFTTPLALQTAGRTLLHLTGASSGTLFLDAGLLAAVSGAPGMLVHHEGRGMLDLGTVGLTVSGATTNASLLLQNAGPGTLAIAAVTGATPPLRTTLANTGTGTLLLGRAAAPFRFDGDLQNAAGGTVRLAGDVEVRGAFVNAGTVALQSAALTLSGATASVTLDGITSTGPGTLVLEGPAALTSATPLPNLLIRRSLVLEAPQVAGDVRVTGPATLVRLRVDAITGNLVTEEGATVATERVLAVTGNVVVDGGGSLATGEVLAVTGDVRLLGGRLDLDADLSVAGRFEQAPGTAFAFGNHTLDLDGALVYRGGTVAPGQGRLLLNRGAEQQLTLDSVFTVHRLAVARTGTRVVVSGAALAAVQEAVVGAQSVLQLGTQHLLLTGDGARLLNEGRITADGSGGVVFADPLHNDRPQRLEGTGTNGNLEIRLSNPADRLVLGAPEVRLAGSLTFTRGHLDLNGQALVLTDTVTIRRNLGGAPDGGYFTGSGRFNPTDRRYHLEFAGTLTAQRPLDPLPSDRVLELRIRTNATADHYAVLLPADLTFGGDLVVGPQAVLGLGDRILTLAGAAGRHRVEGIVRAAAGRVLVAGGGSVRGGDTPGLRGEVEVLWVQTEGTVELLGALRVGGGTQPVGGLLVLSGTVRIALAAQAPADPGDVAQLRQTGGTIQLGAPLEITELFMSAGGTFTLGVHDLVMGAGSRLDTRSPARFEQADDAGGAVVFRNGGELRSGTNPIPRLRIATEGRVALTGNTTVSQRLEHQGGTLDLAGYTLSLAGGTWVYDVAGPGSFYGTTGTLRIAGPVTALLRHDPAVPTLRVGGGAPSAALTLTAADTTARRRLVVLQSLEMVNGGTLHLGLHDVVLTGRGNVFFYEGGAFTAASLDPLDDDANGEIVFAGADEQRLVVSVAAVLPNVRLEGNAFLPSGPLAVTFAQRLVFGNASLVHPTGGPVAFAAGAWIVRRAEGVLAATPQFDGPVDVYYATDGAYLGQDYVLQPGTEIPDAPGRLRRLVIDAGSGPSGQTNRVRLPKPVRVTGELELRSGAFDPGPFLTLAPGATQRVAYRGSIPPHYAGATSFTAEGPVNLIFSNPAGHLPTTEQTLPAGVEIDLLRFEMQPPLADGFEPFLVLHAGRTANRVEIAGARPGALLVLQGDTLTARQQAVLAGGTIYSPTGGLLDVRGDLTVHGATTFSGEASLTVRGTSVLHASLRTVLFRTAGDVILEPGGSLSDDLHLFAFGHRQVLAINGGDDDPQTTDEVITRLTVAQEEDASGDEAVKGPAFTLTTSRQVPVTFYAALLVLRNGLIVTGTNTLAMSSTPGSLSREVAPGDASHVAGALARTIAAGEPVDLLFPVGADYPTAAYRPAVLTRNPAQPLPHGVNLRIEHVDQAPGGTGLPLDGGGVTVRGTAPFYWQLSAAPALDVLPAAGLAFTGTLLDAAATDVQGYRLLTLPRTAEAGTWHLLGSPERYANVVEDAPPAGTPLVRVGPVNLSIGTGPVLVTIGTGAETATDTEAPDAGLPRAFRLYGNYPNPFNPSTTLRFDLPEAGAVQVEVFDLLGRRVVATPVQAMPAGADRTLRLDAAMLASGTYLYRLTARTATQTYTETGRMALVR